MISNSPLPSSDIDDDQNFAVFKESPEAEKASERLKIAVRHGGGNMVVAKRAGIALGTVNNYLAGRDMKTSFMVALAKACGVNVAWLAAGEGQMVGLAPPDVAPSPENPQNSAPQKAFASIDPDRLAKALEAAMTAFEKQGGKPTMRQVAQVTLLLYDTDTK